MRVTDIITHRRHHPPASFHLASMSHRATARWREITQRRWDDWKDICSRRLGIVNGKADLEMHFAGADGSITSDDTNLRMTVTYHTYTDNEMVTVDAALARLLCCVCVDTIVLASQEAKERTSMTYDG